MTGKLTRAGSVVSGTKFSIIPKKTENKSKLYKKVIQIIVKISTGIKETWIIDLLVTIIMFYVYVAVNFWFQLILKFNQLVFSY